MAGIGDQAVRDVGGGVGVGSQGVPELEPRIGQPVATRQPLDRLGRDDALEFAARGPESQPAVANGP